MENQNNVRGNNQNPRDSWRGWFRYFQFKEGDKPEEARTILLIIATLIVAVTFQAVINPPGGVWQDEEDNCPSNHALDCHTKPHHRQAGTAIYASQCAAYVIFLISNTLAISASILILMSLTCKFPFRFEIWVATMSMFVTYGSAVFAVSPGYCSYPRFLLFVAVLPFLMRCLIQTFHKLKASKDRNNKNKEPDAEKQDT